MKNLKITFLLTTSLCNALQASDSQKNIEQKNIVKISGNYKIVEVILNENTKTYKDVIDEYKKVRGLADDVQIKLLAKGEELKPEDTYDIEYVGQLPNIFAIIYRDWHITPRGNLLSAETTFTIRLFSDEPAEKVPVEDIVAQANIKLLKQKIINEITKKYKINEKSYVITITKNGKPLNDTDVIVFTEPLTPYGVELNKRSSFLQQSASRKIWSDWFQQTKNKIALGIAGFGGATLWLWSQKNRSGLSSIGTSKSTPPSTTSWFKKFY